MQIKYGMRIDAHELFDEMPIKEHFIVFLTPLHMILPFILYLLQIPEATPTSDVESAATRRMTGCKLA